MGEGEYASRNPIVTLHLSSDEGSTCIFFRTQWLHELRYFVGLQYINKYIMRDLSISPYGVGNDDVESQDCTVILLC